MPAFSPPPNSPNNTAASAATGRRFCDNRASPPPTGFISTAGNVGPSADGSRVGHSRHAATTTTTIRTAPAARRSSSATGARGQHQQGIAAQTPSSLVTPLSATSADLTTPSSSLSNPYYTRGASPSSGSEIEMDQLGAASSAASAAHSHRRRHSSLIMSGGSSRSGGGSARARAGSAHQGSPSEGTMEEGERGIRRGLIPGGRRLNSSSSSLSPGRRPRRQKNTNKRRNSAVTSDTDSDYSHSDNPLDDEEMGLANGERDRWRKKRLRNAMLDQRIVRDWPNGHAGGVGKGYGNCISTQEQKEADQNVIRRLAVNGGLIGLWYLFSLSISIVSSSCPSGIFGSLYPPRKTLAKQLSSLAHSPR